MLLTNITPFNKAPDSGVVLSKSDGCECYGFDLLSFFIHLFIALKVKCRVLRHVHCFTHRSSKTLRLLTLAGLPGPHEGLFEEQPSSSTHLSSGQDLKNMCLCLEGAAAVILLRQSKKAEQCRDEP